MRSALKILFLLFFAAFQVQADEDIDIVWGVSIPMRDGVELNATIYKPHAQKEPLPVVFTFTPYISDNYHDRAHYFAKNGYVFALVDVRGRGNSDGDFEPMKNEGRDGFDVVEWFAKQPWSNGKITMWGGSYAGFDQWSALKEFPPHLSTIVPVASAHPGTDFPFFKNIFYSYDIQWLSFTSGRTPNERLFGESAFWIQKFRQLYVEHRPFKELDQIVGNTSTHFQTWLKHPTQDEYWDAMVPTQQNYSKMNIPILSITGHYDGDQAGAFEYYKRHMKFGSAAARDKHFLIVGPWDHAGTRTPVADVGGMTFGPASLLKMNDLHKQWYDWTLKNGKKPDFLKKRVAYYVTGAEEWKYADDLESISKLKLTLFLQSSGSANDVFRSGELSKEPAKESKHDEYVYDPLDTRPAQLEKEEVENFITDERYINLFGNGLVYHSEPFSKNTEITGFMKFVAWIEIDVPDTDFQASVYEITVEGKSILLGQDLIRARYRESLRTEKLIKPGEVNQYTFDAFPFNSRRIAQGSRLRLVISNPNTIYLQKNYNSGGVVAEETAKDARKARIRLYHDTGRKSYLELPIGD